MSSLQVTWKLKSKTSFYICGNDNILVSWCQGSREEGCRVAQAAARTITPVTLVLGSKNPCYVDERCEIATAAQRIAWARFHNAGQSLVAPDYVLCHVNVKARLVQALKCCVMQFYGPDPAESRSYGRMVNLELFNCAKEVLCRSGKVAVGGQVIEAEKYIGKLGRGSQCITPQM